MGRHLLRPNDQGILVDQQVGLIGQLIDVIDQQVSQLVNEAMLADGSSGLANK